MASEGESGDKSHLFVFTGVAANKAGMAADKKMVADFVYERSRNSSYSQHQIDLDVRQRARTEALAQELRTQEEVMSQSVRMLQERQAAAALETLEKKRNLERTYCVVDMDMFYAAVAIRDRPELKEKPVAIGGMGMISAANYVARQYGVRSAMPGFIAAEMVRCPHLVGSKMPPDELHFIPAEWEKYKQVAEVTRSVYHEYDPDFTSWSLDEAKLDLTRYLEVRGGQEAADEVVREMRQRIKELTGGLTCSAGIGPNPMLAKIASEDNKPDGQARVLPTREAVLQYIEKLPLRRVPFVGKVLERKLKLLLNVITCGELRVAVPKIRRAFEGKKTCDFLLRVCLGISGEEAGEDDEGPEVGDVTRKSLSTERTFRDESSQEELRGRLRELCRSVAEDMASAVPPLACKVVGLKTKAATFEVRTRQVHSPRFIGFSASAASGSSATLTGFIGGGLATGRAGGQKPSGAVSDEEVSRVAAELNAAALPLLEEQFPCTLRLMGVRVSDFRGARKVLQKGQQQLQKFFGTGTPAAVGDPAASAASAAVEAQALAAEVPPGGVIDLGDSSSGEDGPAGQMVSCPVCGAAVAVDDADRHVNSHYDAPGIPPAGAQKEDSHKRKRGSVAGIDEMLRGSRQCVALVD